MESSNHTCSDEGEADRFSGVESNNMWAELPKGVAGLISERLSITDFIRFGAVCANWHSVVTEKLNHPYEEHPWILLSYHPISAIRGFFSLSDGKAYGLDVPEARGAWCCGSSHGWMIMTHRESGNFLLNPFSRATVELPCVYTRYICKAVLSAAPTTNNINAGKCMVVAIYDNRELAFCRPGDGYWTTLRGQGYEDIIFYRGSLYTLSGEQLAVWKFGPCSEARHVSLPLGRRHYGQSYLVESSGDLMVVFESSTRNGFQLFKQDSDCSNWVAVKSLNGCILLLGSVFWDRHFASGSLSLKANEGLSALGFKKNSIYSSEGRLGCGTYRSVRTFNLEDEWDHMELPSIYRSLQFTPIWVTPKLW